jgi:hypothetical protein
MFKPVATEETTTVYRVQNRQGRGPYIAAISISWVDPKHEDLFHNGLNGHPGPKNDNINLRGLFDYRFCFQSLEQLNNWFTPIELENLKAMGFRVYRITVQTKGIQHGKYQSIFWPKVGDVQNEI